MEDKSTKYPRTHQTDIMNFTIVIWVSSITGGVRAFEKGAPITLCNDAYPHHHGHYRSQTPSPYALSLNTLEYHPNDVITGN